MDDEEDETGWEIKKNFLFNFWKINFYPQSMIREKDRFWKSIFAWKLVFLNTKKYQFIKPISCYCTKIYTFTRKNFLRLATCSDVESLERERKKVFSTYKLDKLCYCIAWTRLFESRRSENNLFLITVNSNNHSLFTRNGHKHLDK